MLGKRFDRYSIKKNNEEVVSKNGIIGEKQTVVKCNHNAQIIDIKDIKRNKYQARPFIPDESLEDIMDSIKREGLLQPIIVLYQNGDYFLVDGERRKLAVEKLGYTQIPCFVTDNLLEATFASISSNSFREEIHIVNKWIEIQSIKDLFKGFGKDVSIDDIAKMYKVANSTVYEWMSFSVLDNEIREYITVNKIKDKKLLRKIIKIIKNSENPKDVKEKVQLLFQNTINSGSIDIENKKKESSGYKDKMPAKGYYIGYRKDSDEMKILKEAVDKLPKRYKKKLYQVSLELMNYLESELS